MPAYSTESWKGSALTRAGDNWIATRIFIVTGAANDDDALSAMPLDGAKIPGDNESHDLNGDLRVRSRTVRKLSPATREVLVEYSIPPSGDYDVITDPLKADTRFSWSPGIEAVSIDRDIRGRAIVNAAGDAIDPPLQRNVIVRTLTAIRNEPYYDLERLSTFEETVSNKDLVIAGVRIAKGDLCCRTISPVGEYTLKSRYVPMQYVWEHRVMWVVTEDGSRTKLANPFQSYVKNVGRRAWYVKDGSTVLGEIYYADNGTQISSDIPLDMQGRPIDEQMRVSATGDNMGVATACPLDLKLKLGPFQGSRVVFLQFDTVFESDFSLLKF